MKRSRVVAVVLTVLVSTVGAAGSGRAAEPHGAPGDRTLTWGTCPPPLVERDSRQECATLTVPLDHRSPQGRTLDLVVSRIQTAQPSLRRGVLVVNTGGPGDIGVDAPSFLGRLLPPEVLDRFDLVSFDPRGVGYSAPISCHFPDAPVEVGQRYPTVDGSIDRNVAYARELASRCATFGGDVLPYVTTANTARDMDLVRAALHEPRISFLGYSYGTYLGAVYKTLYPDRVDRFVLDSADDPTKFGYEQFRLVSLGTALRLPDFTTWAAARNDRYRLGTTAAAVRRTYDTLTARLDAQPVVLPDGSELTGNVLRIVTYEGLYRDANFPALAETWQLLAAGTSPARIPTALLAAPSRQAATDPTIPFDNQPSVQAAIHCNDGRWPRDVATYRRNVELDRRIFPATAGFPPNIWACAFWPLPSKEPAVTVTGSGDRNVLIVQNLRDPATPWVGALGLQRALGRDATLLSVDQGGHTAYLFTASSCTNATTTAFLVSGRLPTGPTLCPGQPMPS